ncbi:hypothetical protein EVAR_51846_1 [Eumeta japonica]|uniref:Uncharacterized protein n=1 Tax=Eumeta variegata TaxID=151549 RepID=A0A4C1YSH2_EUMVA|nr:hypothetical protein EVAR_51846_1 [Eumeta japonica]
MLTHFMESSVAGHFMNIATGWLKFCFARGYAIRNDKNAGAGQGPLATALTSVVTMSGANSLIFSGARSESRRNGVNGRRLSNRIAPKCPLSKCEFGCGRSQTMKLASLSRVANIIPGRSVLLFHPAEYKQGGGAAVCRRRGADARPRPIAD